MFRMPSLFLARPIVVALAAAVFAACSDHSPIAPTRAASATARLATLPGGDTEGATLATIRQVTARYHDLEVAKNEGFVLLHECESRPGEGPVGIVYVNIARLMDGVIDPSSPDALIYEPSNVGGPRLVGAEFAIPYPLWTGQQPPTFMGATFQREDEFGVYALHAWVWRNNPTGMFSETNPMVSCGAE